jgi:hypothetical protein
MNVDAHEPNREQPTGRYAPDAASVCKCGHTLGDHLAEGRVAERECCAPGCGCSGFRKAQLLSAEASCKFLIGRKRTRATSNER